MYKKITFQCAYLDKIPVKNEIIEVLGAAFSSVDPVNGIKNSVKYSDAVLEIGNIRIPINKDSRILVWGLGKASQAMAVGLKEVLGNALEKGAVITKHSSQALEDRLHPEITTFEGSHPVPSEKSIHAAESAVERMGKLSEKDLVIALISGGGSALAVLPKKGITLDDYRKMTQLLLDCGASIQEINTIRKQIDRIKGGGLLDILYPAQVVSLILSDVVGDPLDIIASGPTVPSMQTKKDALAVIKKYALESKVPKNILSLLKKEENKRNCVYTNIINNILVGNNKIASSNSKKAAEILGFQAEVMSATLQGEARELGAKLGKELRNHIKNGNKRKCWIYGGETTVTIHGKGKGGRNQEFILAAAQEIAGLEGGCILSIATDGEDGPTDAAGAIADGNTVAVGDQLGLNAAKYLHNNDAYHYLDAVGSLIRTGPSGTNVNDLVFLFLY